MIAIVRQMVVVTAVDRTGPTFALHEIVPVLGLNFITADIAADSLPGGGVEDGEDVLTALHREVYEETGCVCDEIKELGIVAENRASLDYTQINYYYVVTTTHQPGENHLTESEQASQTVVQWHAMDEMVRLINEQEFDRIQGKYLKARDVAALKEYATW